MSRENLKALEAAYEAFRTGDVDAALAIIDPEIAISDHDRVLDSPKEYRGPQGVMQMTSEAAEAFDAHRYEPEDLREVDDQVMVAVRRRGRGKESGVEVDEAQWHLWEFRGRKAVRLRIFVVEADALEAAGLSE
jgi:ketosteroid isomerase-like protein